MLPVLICYEGFRAMRNRPTYKCRRKRNHLRNRQIGRLVIEQLESRRLLAVQLLYNASNELQLIGDGNNDDVDLLQPAADVLTIDLNGATFAVGSTPGGGNLTYAPDFKSATVGGLSGNSVAKIDVNLQGGDDLLSIGLNLPGSTNIGDITVLDGAGTDSVTLEDSAVGGSLSVTSDLVEISGASIVTANDQSYTGPVRLSTHVTLGGHNVTFNQTVDSDTNGPWDLRVDTVGNGVTWFRDSVGVTHALNNLRTNSDGVTDLDAPHVITVADQRYADPVVLTTDVTLGRRTSRLLRRSTRTPTAPGT